MKLVVAVFVILIGSSAMANFTGNWRGDGTVTTRTGHVIYCDHMEINVYQDEDRIEFGNFKYGCDEFGFNFVPPVLKLEKKLIGQKVSWKDHDVGTISKNKAKLLFPLANEGKARYTVKKSGNKMHYVDEQIGVNANSGAEEITRIEANLVRY